MFYRTKLWTDCCRSESWNKLGTGVSTAERVAYLNDANPESFLFYIIPIETSMYR
jgi:hypothetical protein